MIYAQFYQDSTGWNGKDFSGTVKLIEACGDRSIIILDGRNGLATHVSLARSECEKRGYKAFSIHRGESFTSSNVTVWNKEVLPQPMFKPFFDPQNGNSGRFEDWQYIQTKDSGYSLFHKGVCVESLIPSIAACEEYVKHFGEKYKNKP